MSDAPFVIHLLAWLLVVMLALSVTALILVLAHIIKDMVKDFWR